MPLRPEVPEVQSVAGAVCQILVPVVRAWRGDAMIDRRLTRNEAIVVIWEGVKGSPIPLPDDYLGGWMQILEDALCLSAGTIKRNVIPNTRRDSPLFTQKHKGGQLRKKTS